MNAEIMKAPIKGYEDSYYVTVNGDVFSKERDLSTKRGIYHLKEKKLKPSSNGTGYHFVGLHKNGETKNILVHRLVADAFIPNIDNLPQVNHKNEIKTDKRVENLEWCDGKYNTNYGTGMQRMSAKIGVSVTMLSRSGEVEKIFNSQKEAGAYLGVTIQSISQSIKENQYCKGHKFVKTKE